MYPEVAMQTQKRKCALHVNYRCAPPEMGEVQTPFASLHEKRANARSGSTEKAAAVNALEMPRYFLSVQARKERAIPVKHEFAPELVHAKRFLGCLCLARRRIQSQEPE